MHDPLLTINPISGLLLLALKGNIVPFSDVDQFEIFLDKLNREVESIKEFIGRPPQDRITEDYAHDVIDSWERHLRGENIEPLNNELPSPKRVVSDRQAKSKNKDRGEKPMTQTNQQPQHKRNGSKSKSRINKLKQYSIFSVPDGWDPDELSWVLMHYVHQLLQF